MKTEREARTRRFARDVMQVVGRLPKGKVPDSIGDQLVRPGTSLGANYREAQRAESRADFIQGVAVAEKEASETCYGVELCAEGGIGGSADTSHRCAEAEALLAILVSIGKRAKQAPPKR